MKEALEGIWKGLQGEGEGQLVVKFEAKPEFGDCIKGTDGKGTRSLDVTIFAHVQVVTSTEAETEKGKGKVAVGADFKVTLPFGWAKRHIADCPCEKPKTIGLMVAGLAPYDQVYITSHAAPHFVLGQPGLPLTRGDVPGAAVLEIVPLALQQISLKAINPDEGASASEPEQSNVRREIKPSERR